MLTLFRGILKLYGVYQRLLPMKKTATVPGPEWQPMTGSMKLMVISLNPKVSLIRFSRYCASSIQSPCEMKMGC